MSCPSVATTPTPSSVLSASPGRRRRLLRLAGATAAYALVLAASGCTNAGGDAVPPEAASAIAESGLVYLEHATTGVVTIPLPDGTVARQEATAAFTCSGFVADSAGYVVTAGHCVDTAEDRSDLIASLLQALVHNGTITADRAAELKKISGDWEAAVTEHIDQVVLPQTVAGAGPSQTLTANVVEFRPIGQGDVALLKVESGVPLSTLALAPARPPTGQAVTAVGYPGVVRDLTDLGTADPSQAPTFKNGTVSGLQTEHGFPFLQTDAPVSQGMSGGPVVNPEGQVVGVTSHGPPDQVRVTAGFEFASDVTTIRDILGRHQVAGTVAPGDEAFRAGVVAFYRQNYHAAVQNFDSVLATDPGKALAQKYRRDALAADPNADSFLGVSPRLLAAVVACVLVLGGALGFVLLRQRSRRRGAQNTPPAADPPATPPMGPAGPTPRTPAPDPSPAWGLPTTPGPAIARQAPTSAASRPTTASTTQPMTGRTTPLTPSGWWKTAGRSSARTPTTTPPGSTPATGHTGAPSTTDTEGTAAQQSRCPVCQAEYTGVLHHCDRR